MDMLYSKICLKQPLIGFQDLLSLNAGQKYCRMLQVKSIVECSKYRLMQVKSIAECSPLEHSAILLTFIQLPFVMKIFVLSIFGWSFKTGFTVCSLIFNLSSLKL